MMAKPATRTMMVTITKSASFSSWSAANRLRFIPIQSRIQSPGPAAFATRMPTALASKGSSSLISTPDTRSPSPANSWAAASPV